MFRSLVAVAALALTACSHPLDAVQGEYDATLTVTVSGESTPRRTQTLTGKVLAATDEAVPGTVVVQFSQTVDTSTVTCELQLVGGITAKTPVDTGALSCRFPGEKVAAKPSIYTSTGLKTATPAAAEDFSGGFTAEFDGVYVLWDNVVILGEVRLVGDATAKLVVTAKK